MTATIAKWTIQDYHRLIDAGLLEGRRVELLNGQIIEAERISCPSGVIATAFTQSVCPLKVFTSTIRYIRSTSVATDYAN